MRWFPLQTNPKHYTGYAPTLIMFYWLRHVGPIPHVVNDNAYTFVQTRCYRSLVSGFYQGRDWNIGYHGMS